MRIGVKSDALVSGDPDSLERVLRNLIENALAAIRPNGQIDVHLRRRNGYAEAHFADDGPGVPEAERQRIFERFVRLDPRSPATAWVSPSPAASPSSTTATSPATRATRSQLHTSHPC